jgi:hypothetical protein
MQTHVDSSMTVRWTLVRSGAFLLAALPLVLASCGDPGPESAEDAAAARAALLPGKVGPSGEVVMVASESVWNRAVGAAVDSVFLRPVRVLPQYEPRFDVIRLDPEEFDRFWKPHRNLLVFYIADRIDTQEPSMRVMRSRFAKGQIYVEIKARTAQAAADLLLDPTQGEMLADLLEQEEATRCGQWLGLDRNKVLEQTIRERHGLSSVLPRDAQLVNSAGGFAWIERNLTRMKGGRNHDVQLGIVVHRTPYGGPADFSMKRMLERRDSLLQARVSGSNPGSYMTTEFRLAPRYEEVSFRGGFAATMRGLWRMEGDFMGGPWTSIAWVDAARGQLVTVDGYVYAPYFGKREYLREVEAMVRSFAPIASTPEPSNSDTTKP